MFENMVLISSWITAALLVAVAWFVYKYSKNFVVEVNYWKYISTGILFLAASEIMRGLFLFQERIFWMYWAISVAGGLMVAYGFYRLYEDERV